LELAIDAELENKPVAKMLTMDDIIEEWGEWREMGR
jgi:hypothetical protein